MTILTDTREKKPWDFGFYGFNTRIATLPYGDYTVEGKENIIVVERKASSGELAINLGKEIDRFSFEMERMRPVERKYIICEFSSDDIQNFPKNSGIPKKLWSSIRMNKWIMFDRISSLSDDYNINFVFAGDRQCAINHAVELFRQV